MAVVYQFDLFALETGTRRLLKDGEEIHLSPKAFDLLTVLVENRARAVSKETLQQNVWPSTFVQESNLAGLVVEIRRALGDSVDSPRFIRTMQRFGYWFVGEVTATGANGSLSTRSPVKFWLVWETRQVALIEGENILGRGPDAAVWIDAPGVSRHHARIYLDKLSATLEDLGSKNGTYLGGHRVTALAPLTDGDRIRLGSVVLTFRVPPPGGATETDRE